MDKKKIKEIFLHSEASFGTTLQRIRNKKGVTQEELATQLSEATGKSIQKRTISNWENGTSFPMITYLPVIASLLEMPLASFFDAKITSGALTKKLSVRNSSDHTEYLQRIEGLKSQLSTNPDQTIPALSDMLDELFQVIITKDKELEKLRRIFDTISGSLDNLKG